MTANSASPNISDHRIALPGGSIFARMWSPPAGALAGEVPIILFHDSLGCADLWRDFPGELALSAGRVVVAYDRLGFGRSDPNPDRLKLDFVSDEARTALPALKSALGIRQTILMGHSVGGAMAAVCAAVEGADCLALITESAQTFAEDRTLCGIRAAKSAFSVPGQLDRLMRYHGDKAQWVLDAWTESWLSPGFADWRIDDDLSRVQCPVLAIHGDCDEYGSEIHPNQIVRLTHGPARALILQGCGHVPHKEKPDIVLAAIKDFLARQ